MTLERHFQVANAAGLVLNIEYGRHALAFAPGEINWSGLTTVIAETYQRLHNTDDIPDAIITHPSEQTSAPVVIEVHEKTVPILYARFMLPGHIAFIEVLASQPAE